MEKTPARWRLPLSNFLQYLAKSLAISLFPLFNDEWALHNVVVDDDYQILGIIDWENLYVALWEIVDGPIELLNEPLPGV